MTQLLGWFSSVFPPASAVDRFERMRACAGSLFGIILTGASSFLMLGNTPGAVWLIAPMGASAVLLFAVPASPLAQPWSIIGGNLIAGIIGVTCVKLMGGTVLAAGLAISLAIGGMFVARCIHPPSGAVALTVVLGGPAIHSLGYGFILAPLGVNSLLLLGAALFYNNVTGRRYPHVQRVDHSNKHALKDPEPIARIGITPEDLDAVLQRYNQVLDISRDDLEAILLETEMQAYRRRFGVITCADVMSRDVVSVEFGTTLQQAWELLHKHRVTALPVVGRKMHVVGIITKADFIKHAKIANYRRFPEKMSRLLRPILRTQSAKPEVVGQIMNSEVRVAKATQPIVELVPLMSDAGLHTMPIVDEENRLVGVMTQADLIAALFESNLQNMSKAAA